MLLGVVALTCGLCPGVLSASSAGANVPIEAAVIDAGNNHTCAIEFSGEVLCWGDNFNGQLGDPDVFSSNTAIPVSGLTDAVQVSAGGDHTCALRETGQVLCWGDNLKGQLGDGTTTQRHTPTPVSGLNDAVEVSAGDEHTCAIKKTGQAVCWGNGLTGQIGNGTSGPFPVKTPAEVSGLDDAEMIGAGRGHSCAIKESGQAVCWGNNLSGELGQGTTDGFATTPVPVSGVTDAALIAVGSYHACAIRKSGRVVCWGWNSNGQLGNGVNPGPANVPLPLDDAEWISAGEAHTCAIRASGPTRCWGLNASGQLGDGGIIDQPFPTKESVTGLADAWDVSAGGAHSCAVRETGEALCWGFNIFGQLGNGGNTGSLLPVTVVETPFEPEEPTPAPRPVPIAAVPAPPPPPKKPNLAITKLVPKTLTVRPGGTAKLKLKVKNTGKARARGVKACPAVPRKARSSVEALGCKTLGAIAPGASKTAAPSVTVTAKAEGQITVKIKVSSANAGGGSVSVTLKLAS